MCLNQYLTNIFGPISMKRSFKFGNGNESWLGEVYKVKNVISWGSVYSYSQFLLFHLNINLIMQNKLNIFHKEIRPKQNLSLRVTHAPKFI